MNQDMNREMLIRKKTIEKYVEMLYGRFTHLFPERLDDLKAKAVEKFLNTNLSYDEIIQILLKIVEEREKGTFLSIEDVQKRGKVSQTLIDKMKTMGILDDLPDSNQLSLF